MIKNDDAQDDDNDKEDDEVNDEGDKGKDEDDGNDDNDFYVYQLIYKDIVKSYIADDNRFTNHLNALPTFLACFETVTKWQSQYNF